jgi:hypothetical protein
MQKISTWALLCYRVPVFVDCTVDIRPVIETSPLQAFIVQIETKRTDEMESRIHTEASAPNVSGIPWYQRPEKDHVDLVFHIRISPVFSRLCSGKKKKRGAA